MYGFSHCLLAFLLALTCIPGHGAKRWAGGNDGEWGNMLNWQPEGVPGASDSVLLNNDVNTSGYTITLPDVMVSIQALIIAPASGNLIQLLLPVSNAARPALLVQGTNHAIITDKGGSLINSSGLSSGESLQLNGLLLLRNGGKYIHRTRSSHANEIVAKLSTEAGTERGIFEFDVPGGSYPISLSNRTYGVLILSAVASGGVQTYNASGTNPVAINGDFEIGTGVQFNADMSKNITINGSYIQRGGVFNLSSQPNNNSVIIKGDIIQSGSGVITETSSGLPSIELAGSVHQQVSLAGSITNDVTFKINNTAGVFLRDHLIIGFRLELLSGKMKTTSNAMITLLDNAVVTGGSTYSFIDGPFRKKGDEDFTFPIGKQGDFAPVKIQGTTGQATDEFTAEYFLANPGTDYGNKISDPAIVRISALEYWVVERNTGSTAKRITFPVGTYSGATALDKLVVTGWVSSASTWANHGNTFYAGVATGYITSKDISEFGVFTLASTTSGQNPLSLRNSSNPIGNVADQSAGGTPGFPSIRLVSTMLKDNAPLEIKSSQAMSVFFSVYDVNGRLTGSGKQPMHPGINLLRIGRNNYPPGQYILLLAYKGARRTIRFMKI